MLLCREWVVLGCTRLLRHNQTACFCLSVPVKITQTTSQLHRQKTKQNTAPQITDVPKCIRPIVPVRKQIGKMLLIRAKLFLRLDLKVLLVLVLLVLLVVIGVRMGRYWRGRRQ
jgi:hypothetical protein